MIHKPQPDEFVPFYNTYISKVPDGDLIGFLERSKDSTYQLFNKLSAEKANYAYGEGKWTLKEVIGHIIDTERVFSFRAYCFSRDFTELPGFDQDIYVANSIFNNRSIQDLAAEFKAVRESNLFFIKALTDDQLNRKGIASGNQATVRALIYMIAGHELHHVNIVKERYL